MAAAINQRVAPPSPESRTLKTFPKAFSSTFSVTDESLRPIARAVNLSSWSDKGEFAVHGVMYSARREGVMSGAFLLEWGSLKSQVSELPERVPFLVKIREKNYGDSVLTTYERETG